MREQTSLQSPPAHLSYLGIGKGGVRRNPRALSRRTSHRRGYFRLFSLGPDGQRVLEGMRPCNHFRTIASRNRVAKQLRRNAREAEETANQVFFAASLFLLFPFPPFHSPFTHTHTHTLLAHTHACTCR